MIRSMTGFGREQAVVSGREIIAEIRSVNHKFFEFSSKLPRNYQYLEPKLKTMLKEKITRGKVELSLLVYNIDVKDTSVKVNEQVASQYIEAIRTIAPDLGITDDLSASDLFRIPDVFTVIKEETDEEQLWADISSVVGSALDKFIAMRETEGAALKADVLEKADVIEDMVSKVEIYSPESTAAYRKKLEVHAWSRFEGNAHGAAAARLCAGKLDGRFEVVNMQELVWRLRMSRHPEQTLEYLNKIF